MPYCRDKAKRPRGATTGISGKAERRNCSLSSSIPQNAQDVNTDPLDPSAIQTQLEQHKADHARLDIFLDMWRRIDVLETQLEESERRIAQLEAML